MRDFLLLMEPLCDVDVKENIVLSSSIHCNPLSKHSQAVHSSQLQDVFMPSTSRLYINNTCLKPLLTAIVRCKYKTAFVLNS